MKNNTRQQFNRILQGIKQYYQVDDPSTKFTVIPDRVEFLIDSMQESAGFLNEINIVSVGAQKGRKLGLGVGSPVASRTNTDEKDRQTTYVGKLDKDDYFCEQTNFDTHISYRTMDAWGHLSEQEFRSRYQYLRQLAGRYAKEVSSG